MGNPREPWDCLGPSFRAAAEASGHTHTDPYGFRMDSVWIRSTFQPQALFGFLRTTRFFFGKDSFPWENLRITLERLKILLRTFFQIENVRLL